MFDELREPKGPEEVQSTGSVELLEALRDIEASKHDAAQFEADNPHISPDQVYTELIIVEHALRSQYIELQRSRRRGLLFFGTVVGIAVGLTYRVRYDPPVYKLARLVEKLLMIALYITAGLFMLTGMFTKVFSVAPRFLTDTNKGLKSLNFRMVKIQTNFKERVMRFFGSPVYSEDPAGPVKLVLSPKEFSPQYIENWEIFRDEYWDRQQRRRIRAQTRKRQTNEQRAK